MELVIHIYFDFIPGFNTYALISHFAILLCPEGRSGARGTVSQRVIRLADQSSETLHVMPKYDRGI